MGHWNYRVMRHQVEHADGEVETSFAVHEVYYNDDGTIRNWTSLPASMVSDEADFSFLLAKLPEAIAKPVLDYKTGVEITAS